MKLKTTKIFTCFIISLMMTFVVTPNVKAASNFIVTNKTELTQAISNAVNGDTIEFQNFTDTLSSTLNISKSLTFTHATPGFSLKVSGNFSHMTIYSSNAVLNFNNVTLDGSNVGGGIFKPGIGGSLEINGVQITRSTTVNGGAINVARETHLTLNNAILNYNIASSGGGAIYTGIDAIVNINDSVIDHNTANGATESGGGAYFGIGSAVTIIDTEITYNNGPSRGGGVYLENTGTIEFTNSTLAHNNSGIHGGALYVDETAVARFINSVVDSNSSSSYSGGILLTTNSTLYFSGGAITNNTSLNAAGGIGAFNTNPRIYLEGGTTIDGNTSNIGGGIYIQQATGQASIVDTDFSNNRALTGDGGAIYTANLNNVNVDALSQFSNNQAVSSTTWTVGSAELPTSSTMHNNHIQSTTFTNPFTNAYNNYDINFKTKKVNFLANGGTGTNQSVNAEQTGIVTFINNPFTPPVGKEFVRWNNQADGNGVQNYLPTQTLTMGNTDLSFYAIYDLGQYKAMFDLNGGNSSSIDDQLLNYGDSIVKPTNPTKTGFTFNNWNTLNNGSGTTWDFVTGTMPGNDLTLFAQWTVNNYRLNFNLNGGGGTAPNSQDLDFGSFATQPQTPTREGYTFNGWSTTQDGTGILWDFTVDRMPDNNVILYAQWSANQYILSFNLNGGGGSNPISQNVDYGALAMQPSIPKKQGYVFNGWNTTKDGSGQTWNFETNTMPANDVTLYAQWTKQILPETGDSSNAVLLSSLLVLAGVTLIVINKSRILK